MFSYPCPNCAMRLNAPPERAGQRTMCPKCLKPILIPSPDQVDLFDTGEDADPLAYDESSGPPQNEASQPRAAPAPPTTVDVRSRSIPAQRRAADSGRIVFSSADLSPMDLAADLTTAISMRMRPPPDPPADLSLSTGVWLLLTVGGLVLWAVGIAYESAVLPFVALLGGLQAALGYIWCAYLVGTHNPTRGLLTLLPPVGLVRMFRPFGENGFRPLRFFLSGLLVLAAWMVAEKVKPNARNWLASLTAPPAEYVPPNVGSAERLRTAVERNQPDLLVALLNAYARPETIAETPEEDRPAVVLELEKLLKADTAEVRAAALETLVAWSPGSGRDAALHALKSSDPGERRSAMALAARWRDPEMAAAVAARLTDRQEQNAAQEVLAAMGGPAAEAALLPLLKADDQLFVLFILDLVEKIGGPKTLDALNELSLTGKSKSIREQALRVAEVLSTKMNPKK